MPLTNASPKAMVRVRGRPLLEWVFRWLKRNGIDDIVVGVAYRKESIQDYFRDGSKLGLKLQYSTHTVEGGTAEGLGRAIARSINEEDFLALNCDQFTDLDVANLSKLHFEQRPVATIAVARITIPFGQVKLDTDHTIAAFVEKPLSPFYCSMGIYVFNRKIVRYLPKHGDLEKTSFPKLAGLSLLKAYVHKGSFITVNTQKDLSDAEREIPKLAEKGAL